MSNSTRNDEEEAKFRAEWLHKHKAPKNWIILTIEEIRTVKKDMEQLKKEIEKWRGRWHESNSIIDGMS